MFAGARFVHLTGITPALSRSCASAIQRAIELARAVGAQISFDPNYRPRLWKPEEAQAALTPIIRACDILLMGHEDARAVLNVEHEEAMLEIAAAMGPKIVVLKRSERGALALADGVRYEAPAFPAERVIDPVGAGDGFDAGFLAGLLRGTTILEALTLGARVGAGSVAALGDYAGYPQI
jgi:2-dehydro-3-deoxygluconokinase